MSSISFCTVGVVCKTADDGVFSRRPLPFIARNHPSFFVIPAKAGTHDNVRFVLGGDTE
jgi:hypothetical protein